MMDGDVQVERLGKVDASDAFSEVNRTVRIKQVGSGTTVLCTQSTTVMIKKR